jgi:hypothetical protein
MTDIPTATDSAKGPRARWRKPRLKVLIPGTPGYDRAETLLGAALRRPGDWASAGAAHDRLKHDDPS